MLRALQSLRVLCAGTLDCLREDIACFTLNGLWHRRLVASTCCVPCRACACCAPGELLLQQQESG
jgi:hypothetical protein